MGACTSMQLAGVADSRILRHMGWAGPNLLQVYFDHAHDVTESTDWTILWTNEMNQPKKTAV